MWVEHVEVDDRAVHNIYRALVNSGLAFGAKRWVSTLDRQCERLASVMASNMPAGEGGGNLLLLSSKSSSPNFTFSRNMILCPTFKFWWNINYLGSFFTSWIE